MTLLSSASIEIPNWLGVAIFTLVVPSLFIGAIWVLVTLEKRVEKYIRVKAQEKDFTFLTLRETSYLDGKNPFGNFDVWVGGSSRILGFSGERVFNRIVTIKEESKEKVYWVKVKTSAFMPSSIQWKEIK